MAEGLIQQVTKLLPGVLDNKSKTGVPFTSGTLAFPPNIRPSSLPFGFPAPPDWSNDDYSSKVILILFFRGILRRGSCP